MNDRPGRTGTFGERIATVYIYPQSIHLSGS